MTNAAVSGGQRRGVLIGALAIGAALVLFVVVLATRPAATSNQADSPLLGLPAPSVTGTGLSGRPVDLAAMRGRFVLVNFFASWCGPCHVEQPSLVGLSHSVAVLGVVYNDSASLARRFLASGGGDWPALEDDGGGIALRFGVRGPPESYLVSPDGAVVAKVLGPVGPRQISYLDDVMARTLRSGQ